jgi:CheY-like chemotaxis protein
VNARDAMPDGGELHIETANIELDEDYAKTHTGVRPGRYVLLAVSDTGHGMSQEVQKHAFEPFFTTKATGKGTGLGLAIVYGIVKKHDGEISVYSDEGKGTTFKIYLPAAAIGGEPAESFESAQTMPGGTETILVVEDEQPVRRMAVKILSELGYTVWDAPDASAALEALEKSRTAPDILLTDLIMPGMNGKELADKCRQRFSKMPIVLMSGYTSGILKYKDMLKSDMHVLMKPFAPMDLALKVRKALDERPGK